MKLIIATLVFLLGILQYQLWFTEGGILSAFRLQHAVDAKSRMNQALVVRNQVLHAEIQDLKRGRAAIEAHARYDLGMVRKGEIFYQVTAGS